MKSRKGYLIGGIAVAVAFGVLLFKAVGIFGGYSFTVTQFANNQASLGMSVSSFNQTQASLGSSEIKVHGWVASSGVTGQSTLTITDGKQNLSVVADGGVAAKLVPGTEVVVQGTSATGSLQAKRITTTKDVKIEGPLSPDVDVEYDVATRTTRFAITDARDSTAPIQMLPVVYTGEVPDTFFVDVRRVDVSMIVIGRLGPNGVFTATGIQTKCASKYQAAPETPASTSIAK